MEDLEVGGSAGLGLGLVVVLVKLAWSLCSEICIELAWGDFLKHNDHFKNVIV